MFFIWTLKSDNMARTSGGSNFKIKMCHFLLGMIKGVTETNLVAVFCCWWIHEFFCEYWKETLSTHRKIPIHQEQKSHQISPCYTLYHYPLITFFSKHCRALQWLLTFRVTSWPSVKMLRLSCLYKRRYMISQTDQKLKKRSVKWFTNAYVSDMCAYISKNMLTFDQIVELTG